MRIHWKYSRTHWNFDLDGGYIQANSRSTAPAAVMLALAGLYVRTGAPVLSMDADSVYLFGTDGLHAFSKSSGQQKWADKEPSSLRK